MLAPMNRSNEYSRGPAGQEAGSPPLLEGCRKSGGRKPKPPPTHKFVKVTLNFPQRPPITWVQRRP